MDEWDREDLIAISRRNVIRRRWKTVLFFAQMGAVLLAVLLWKEGGRLWPDWLLPSGIPINSQRAVTGFLTVAEHGRPAEFTTAEDLLSDWRHWVQQDERLNSAQCLSLPEDERRRLLSQSSPRPGVAGRVQYWVELNVQERLGRDACGEAPKAIKVAAHAQQIISARPVSCSRDVFVAHGFVCPNERRSTRRISETHQDFQDYYPVDALHNGTEGAVKVRVERDATGSPINCDIVQSSKDGLLDRQTCKLVGTDPAFTPTQEHLDTPLTQTVTWRLPEEAGR